jgi:hypothetical protein
MPASHEIATKVSVQKHVHRRSTGGRIPRQRMDAFSWVLT